MGSSKDDIAGASFGFSALLRSSVRIFHQHLAKVALIGFAVYLPIEAFMAWVVPHEVVGIKSQFEQMQVEAIFEVLFGTVAAIVVIRLTTNAIDGKSTALGEVWKQARRRYFSAVATTLAMNVVILGLLVLLVVPALFGMVYVTFYLQVVTLREDTGFHALRHSKTVIEGRFWRVAGYALLFTVCQEGLGMLGSWVSAPVPSMLIGALGDVVGLFFWVVSTVLYLHLDRTRFGYEEASA